MTIENDREMEFDENNEDSPSNSKRRRVINDNFENEDSKIHQSYSSGSSSESINSEIIAAYQGAL